MANAGRKHGEYKNNIPNQIPVIIILSCAGYWLTEPPAQSTSGAIGAQAFT
jgi:hypothetical protein